MEQPLMVSIRCLAYNQEAYIRQCLDGFVMQQTNFRFEAIVHDDASTDHTADIIREYAKKYPDIIKPIYETENQYSKQDGSLRRIMNDACKGKYIAMCEGDDYWTDPLKLQKQVDFLEEHPDFSLCFHNVKIWKQKEGVLVDDFITRDVPLETDICDMAVENYIHTPSALYRNDERIISFVNKIGQVRIGDYVTWMACAQFGKIYKMKECMAVYRFGIGIWSASSGVIRLVEAHSTLNKLCVAIDDVNAKNILEKRVSNLNDYIIDKYKLYEEKLNSYQFSMSYRLCYFILTPFRKIKSIITKNYHKKS